MKFLIDLKVKDNKDEPIKKLASIINWVYCYKDNISTLLLMFSTLSLVVDDLFEKIKNINEFWGKKYSESEQKSSIVNNALLLVMEFILKILTSNENIYVDSKKDNEIFYELIYILHYSIY